MSESIERPDVDRILRTLKPFQRRTVDYVFRRMYTDPDPAHRFLVADEVGLGKTLVARGLIARAIDHLWDDVDRVDVVYICSNRDIAHQNIARMNITSRKDFNLASRVTLLPLQLQGLKGNKLNFVSFTPGTSFDLKSSLGQREERSLLYLLLKEAWEMGNGKAPLRVFQGNAGADSFDDSTLQLSLDKSRPIDEELKRKFLRDISAHDSAARRDRRPTLRERFDELRSRVFRYSSRVEMPRELSHEHAAFIGELRDLLARSCLEALEPDLIILDEFQRFKHLLSAEDEAGELARQLFNYGEGSTKARVLLLSATPYKMYTLYGESEADDHYRDFTQTLEFLEDGSARGQPFHALLKAYRDGLYQLADGDAATLHVARTNLESRLRRVMSRTERLAVTEDRSGMLTEVPSPEFTLTTSDVRGYRTAQSVADHLEQGDVLEYWKSAPYLFNFMDDYSLKRAFSRASQRRDAARELGKHLAPEPRALLRWRDIREYREVDPGNARLRQLQAAMVDNGAWRLLWVPPALPYCAPEGAFAEPALQNFSKRLVFSSWKVVPKVISSLLSYEVERRVFKALDPKALNNAADRKARSALLRFSRSEGRLTGMPVLGLLYPSFTLAELGRNIVASREGDGAALPSIPDVLEQLRRPIESGLPAITSRYSTNGSPDEAWYWAAPLLMDMASNPTLTRDWLKRAELLVLGAEEEDEPVAEKGWRQHVSRAIEVVEGKGEPLGLPPADLAEVLARLALSGPGNCALRALAGAAPEGTPLADPALRHDAARIAWALRSLFNGKEATAILRAGARTEDTPYWLRVLEYSAEGNLQSVLDEYVHILRESEGCADDSSAGATATIAGAIVTALGLRTAVQQVDHVRLRGRVHRVVITQKSMRSHFALRFGANKSDNEQDMRPDHVRRAFNSPFWPFVLATTSVGQEGLDFHSYCHSVVHWNLPANPVDMEQREGRVHRYKGHAVRRNVATAHRRSSAEGTDPWKSMFDAAQQADSDTTGLVPYWVYPVEGGATIERHVPAFPLSRDQSRLEGLRRSLAIYRMVFGQPRQEDLMAFLLKRVGEEKLKALATDLQIDLSPPEDARPDETP